MCHTAGDMGCQARQKEVKHQVRVTGASLTPEPQSQARAQSYLFPLPFRSRRALLAWMCQRDSEVATCRTMMLMESMWMEKSWEEGASVRDVQLQHSPRQPLTKPIPHLAKKPQQGGFKSQGCFTFASIGFSGSLRNRWLQPRALLEICADSHLAKTQLKVAPTEEQHGQLLQ